MFLQGGSILPDWPDTLLSLSSIPTVVPCKPVRKKTPPDLVEHTHIYKSDTPPTPGQNQATNSDKRQLFLDIDQPPRGRGDSEEGRRGLSKILQGYVCTPSLRWEIEEVTDKRCEIEGVSRRKKRGMEKGVRRKEKRERGRQRRRQLGG